MKKYLLLLAICMPLMAWSENPTHTLSIEVGTTAVEIQVYHIDGSYLSDHTVLKKDTLYIDTYQLVEGETYVIKINPTQNYYESGNVYSYFTAWMRDGAVYSTDRELRLTMGKSDISLTAVMTRSISAPYSPNANYFDAATGTLMLDELRNGTIAGAYEIARERYKFTRDDLVSIVVIGALNSNVSIRDFYNFTVNGEYYSETAMNNLMVIDMSQTSGMSTLKQFYGSESYLPKLEHIILGASLESIEDWAFSQLNINTIDCYATTPPKCSSSAFDYMNVDRYKIMLRVPAESIELYRQAPGWEDFYNIQPLYETSNISVTLPTNVSEDYYEDMTVELTNIRSLFVQNRKVLNKREIAFGSQIRGNEYQASLKNAYGQIMGQTEPVELGENDLKLSIDKLLRTKDVSLKVTTSDGKDVTDKVGVLWTDETDKVLGHTSRLKAVAENAQLTCKVTLRGDFARQYVAPADAFLTVNGEGENLLTIPLESLRQMALSGQVKDKETGENIADATVALTQRQGEESQAITATTDDDGRYQMQGINTPGELSVSAPGYLPQTVSVTPTAGGTLPAVEMEPFNGVIVNTWLTYSETVPEDSATKVTDGYDGYSDISYQVVNNTKNTAIKDFIIKENMLYFLSNVSIGDEVTVTVSSRSNDFGPVSASCEIPNSGLGFVSLPIVQNGCLKAEASHPDTISVMGVLYDANGRFVRSNTYKSNGLSFAGLAAGDYSLITMTSNTLLRRALLLSTLDNMGLVEGTDYAKTAVHIANGRILSVNVGNVPVLDMEKLHFTDSRSYFIANDNVVNVGQFVNIQSKYYFTEQYANRIENVEFVVDMPEEIDLVENSAFNGSSASTYRIEDGHYIFPSENTEYNSLSFCLKSKKSGEFRVFGSVRFTLDGAQIVQPIGTVWVQFEGITLKTPVFVSSLSLYVGGTAPWICRGGYVEIYDFDNLVGNTIVEQSGIWRATIQYPTNSTINLHAIKARLTTPEEEVMESEVEYVVSRDNDIIAERVVMLDQRKNPIKFYYYENTVSPDYYTYILDGWWTSKTPYNTTFTFLAYFKDLDISKVESAKIAVLASDGTTRTLEAKYDATKQCYYASSNYPNASKIPISAYAYIEKDYSPMSEEENDALQKENEKALEKVTKAAIHTAQTKGEIGLLPSDGETLNLSYTVQGKEPYAISTELMNYDEALTFILQNRPFVYKGDNGNMVYTLVDGADEIEMILADIDEHIALRSVISDAEISNLSAMPHKNKKYDLPVYTGLGSEIISWLGLMDYFKAPGQLMDMRKRSIELSEKMQKQITAMEKMLDKTCSDGTPNFTEAQQIKYGNRIYDKTKECNHLLGDLKSDHTDFIADLTRKVVWDVMTTALSKGFGEEISEMAIAKLGPKAVKAIGKAEAFLESDQGELLSSSLGFINDLLSLQEGDSDIPSLDEVLGFDFKRHYDEYLADLNNRSDKLMADLDNLRQEITQRQQCADEEEECEGEDCGGNAEENGGSLKNNDDDAAEDDDESAPSGPGGPNGPYSPKKSKTRFPKSARPCIDPSGYVYEAVPSNRVEGATATVYYKDIMLNASGSGAGERDVLWDAENFGQVNPQTTGADGMYQWDVPQGIWQVRVSKEGYENNQSDWLPVPPPQLDVNIPIVRTRLPKVENAHAYEDAVTVKFDTYMMPEFLNTDQITVTENGNTVAGTIELTNEEAAADGVTYASQLRFAPSKLFTANQVTLNISGLVQNYSGIEMDKPFEAVLPIEREVKSLKAAKTFNVRYEGSGILHVKGEPAAAAAGKTVTVQCESGLIASTIETMVVLDQNGEAEVTVNGDLPGIDYITFSMADPELTASTMVKVIRKAASGVEAPEASVPSETEVEKGTKITLSCSTEGAVIYYTLDGSNPSNSDTRILYNAPIVINEETTIKAVAVVEGKGESAVITWHYTVSATEAVKEVKNEQSSNRKYIQDGQLLIERNGKIFNAQGVEVR